MKKICIIGSGSWGVAIGIHAANTVTKLLCGHVLMRNVQK